MYQRKNIKVINIQHTVHNRIMSRAVINNSEVLRFLHKAKPQYRKAILKAADENLVRCLCECVHNTLKGRVRLSSVQQKKLSKHRNILRRLARKGESLKVKKKFIIQKGGAFLPLLLAPLITGVLGSIFNK